MDYEKKYNEALAWMRELYPRFPGAFKEEIEHYFPELRESEDEMNDRMRGRVIESLVCYRIKVYDEGDKEVALLVDEEIAWMKKQKEQKPINQCNTHEPTLDEARKWNEAYEKGYSLGYENGKNEQKPAWSEEDRKMLADTLNSLKRYQLSMPNYQVELQMRWLKSLRPSWKPSEEQMEALEKAIVRSCSHQYGVPLSELYEQLKKL